MLLGWAMQRGMTRAWDEGGLRALSGVGAAGFWRGVSLLGDSWVRLTIAGVAIALLLLFQARDAWRRAAQLAVIVLGGLVLNGAAKQVASRPRPGLLQHLEKVEGFSFPSGHSAGMTVLALGLALTLAPRRHRVPALAAAVALLLLVGLSRIALAVHWPSDVLAGWIEGAGWVLLVRAFAEARRG